MNMSLTPELAKYAQDQVAKGHYSSINEVVEAALARLMLDPLVDHLDEADQAAIDESESQIARGEAMDWKDVSAGLRKDYLGE